jgi:processive 1,2-diacylglycerol beta-glucosyltransferase
VPGQEEGNYELLRRTGAGALAETPAAVMATLRAAFADQGAQWRQWRTALEPIVRNSAAQVIAAHLMAPASVRVKGSALNAERVSIPAAALP